jgi:hypothetical protein
LALKKSWSNFIKQDQMLRRTPQEKQDI